jgi:hypothetical protein
MPETTSPVFFCIAGGSLIVGSQIYSPINFSELLQRRQATKPKLVDLQSNELKNNQQVAKLLQVDLNSVFTLVEDIKEHCIYHSSFECRLWNRASAIGCGRLSQSI